VKEIVLGQIGGVQLSEFKIRHGSTADINFLWEMLYQAIYVPEGHTPPSKDIINEPHIKQILEGWGRSGDLSFIAMDISNQPVGAVWIRLFSEDNKTFGYVDQETPILGIALHPHARGKGIGTLLMEAVLKEAKELGYKKMSLSVDPNNPALRLYERFGFKKIGVDGTSWDMVTEIV
jgi:[ribosomal protein S18]-alanine N-acetyltransferase